MNIRMAKDRDVNALAPLFAAYRVFYEQAPEPDREMEFLAERLAREECVVLIADAGAGEVCGFTLLYPTFDSVDLARIWVLHDLFVAQEFRRQGVARALMEAARAYCEAQGARRVDLATAVTNVVAQPLYESLGYRRDDEFYHYSLSIGDHES